MILLVHSCDKRQWLWKHWWKFFKRSEWDIYVMFITGNELFSDQLWDALMNEDCEYIWYTLDDFFIRESIDWRKYERLAIELKADALRLQPNIQFNSLPYHFEWKDGLLKQTENSAYTMSLQTSIWRREYFLECLEPGHDPWELEKTKPRLGDVYFVPELPFWYIDATRKGILTDKAKRLL